MGIGICAQKVTNGLVDVTREWFPPCHSAGSRVVKDSQLGKDSRRGCPGFIHFDVLITTEYFDHIWEQGTSEKH